MSRSFFFQTLLKIEHVFFAARLVELGRTLITEAASLEEPVIGSVLFVSDPIPACNGPPERLQAPVEARLFAEEVPGTVAVKLRAKLPDLLGGELTAITSGSLVNKPRQVIFSVAPAPVEETRARAACNVDDIIESIADSVESHGLIARARRAVFFLLEGAMECCGLFVTESKLSCSHTTR